ncbi:MAG TPA: hypothetical protein VEL77_07905 [Rugosimonospora sp.]|nr:hypothetical protein [Rugosimonospora sp.]
MLARDADPGRIGAHGGNGTQQELGEVAEGGGFLARDAPLREQAKHLGEGAVHAGGGGEIAAGGMEFGKVECGADDVTSGHRVAEQLVFSFGVEAAEGGMNVGASHSALAPVGKAKLAAVGQLVGVYVDFFMRQRRPGLCYARKLLIAMTFARRDALLALDNLIIARELVIVGLVGREFGAIQLSRILDEKRKRRNGVCEWFLYGSHMQCYRRSTLRSMANDVDN